VTDATSMASCDDHAGQTLGLQSICFEFRWPPRRSVMRERRLSPRVETSYPVRLKGMESGGRRFKEETLVQNLSSGGLYLQLSRAVPIGSDVALVARLSTTPEELATGVRLAARGTVLRVEPKPDGAFGVAVKFNQRRVF
jgi:hypothetical protein